MRGFFKFGSPVVELLIEGKKIEMLLDTGFNGHKLLHKCKIIIERNKDIVELTKSK